MGLGWAFFISKGFFMGFKFTVFFMGFFKTGASFLLFY